MGIDSDGKLMFGFKVGDHDNPPAFLQLDDDGDLEDFDAFVLKDTPLGLSWTDRMAKIEACPAEFVRCSTWDYPIYVLAVRGATLTACIGRAVAVAPEFLAVSPDRIAAFRAWCEECGIAWQEPGWLLATMYG